MCLNLSPSCSLAQVPYRVVADASGNVKIVSSNANKEFAPEEISAVVLRKLSEVCEWRRVLGRAGRSGQRGRPGKAWRASAAGR